MNKLKIYSEEGCRCLVEVLSDEVSTNDEGNEMRYVRARIVHTFEQSKLGSLHTGDEVNVSAVVGFETYVGWEFYEPTEKELAYAS